MKLTSVTYCGGGGSSDQRCFEPANPQSAGKISSKKAAPDLEPGAPDIAPPDEEDQYERQLAFIYAWFLETLERVESDDKKAAPAARSELQTLFLNLLGQLLRVALKSKGSAAKKWAGEFLGNVYQSIDKYDEKLSKANAAYRAEKAKIGSKSVTAALFSRSRITKVVLRELKTAERYQKRLLLLNAIRQPKDSRGRKIPEAERQRLGLLKDWKEAARKESIPEAYWPLVKLPGFSLKSWREWDDFLWPFITAKIDIKKMPPLKVREYDKQRWRWRKGSPVSLPGKQFRKRSYSDLRRQVRGILESRATLRDDRVL